MLADYDKECVDNYISGLKNGTSGYRIYDMPVNGFVINNAKKVIVHSFEAKRKLLEKDFGRDVRQIWSYARPSEEPVDGSNQKERFGFEKEDIIIAAFGHIHETKRAIPILEAFANINRDNSHAKLVFVGKLDNSIKGDFKSRIKELKIEDSVKVTGYTEIDEFVDYMVDKDAE